MINVGETLKEARKKRGLTIEQVAKATRIRGSFLLAIEEGDYKKLPSGSYAHGFVKNYLEFMDLPEKEYLARFRREYDESEQRKLMPEGLLGKETIALRKFSLTQALWSGVVVILLLFCYLLFQYRAAVWSPQLTIVSPIENAKITMQTVMVSGSTDENTAITVNGLSAYVDANGKFIKEIPVFPGKTTLIIKAVNSFGKITTMTRDISVEITQ